ncbi:MAG: EAL domain-containing protein [Chromatiales bacterium]|nr:EAL domain-containing protein [Chromatiales bacterium]
MTKTTDTRTRDKLREQAEQLAASQPKERLQTYSDKETQSIIHDLQVHQIELEMQNEELRNAQVTISESRDRYSMLYESAPVGYLSLNEKGIVTECNTKFCEMIGLGREKIIKYPIGRFILDSESPILKHLLNSKANVVEHELGFVCEGGKSFHGLFQLHRTKEPHQQSNTAWLAAVSDITKIYDLAMELQIKSKAIDTTLESVMIVDNNTKICFVNKAFEKTTGYTRNQVLGKNPRILRSGKHTSSFYQDMWEAIAETGIWCGEIWNRKATGEAYPEWLNISTIYDDRQKPAYYVGVFSDITKEQELRLRLHELAYHDSVTNLPNRHLFMDRLEQEILHAQRNHTYFSLLFMDLDRFKSINDTLGHSTGDQLLKEVANRLSGLLRENDTIARMGGDEFIILLPTVDTASHADNVAKKILQCMSDPFDLAGRQYHIRMSIGISRYPDDGIDSETLIKNADIAMYKAKEKGRDTYHSYNKELNENIFKKVDLERDLREGLNNNALTLVYQPQIDLDSGKVSGVEALMRWNHPVKGLVMPSDFIWLAEETGLIVTMGYWALREALNQYQTWLREGIDVGILSVNLSPHQFLQSNLVDNMIKILHETGMPSDKLGVEITESAAMPNIQHTIETLEAFQKMGITVFIDDFGSGFSSLSLIRRLPIDVLKIDRQFINEIPGNPDDVAIAQAIIAMAQTLNLEIVAEGVETLDQLRFLQQHGCNAAQGYLFSKPVEPSGLNTLNLSL